MENNLKNIVSGDCVIIAIGMNMETGNRERVAIAVLNGEIQGISPLPEGMMANDLLTSLGMLKMIQEAKGMGDQPDPSQLN